MKNKKLVNGDKVKLIESPKERYKDGYTSRIQFELGKEYKVVSNGEFEDNLYPGKKFVMAVDLPEEKSIYGAIVLPVDCVK